MLETVRKAMAESDVDFLREGELLSGLPSPRIIVPLSIELALKKAS